MFPPTVSGNLTWCKSDLGTRRTFREHSLSALYQTQNLQVHEAQANEEDQIVRPKRLMIWFSWRPKRWYELMQGRTGCGQDNRDLRTHLPGDLRPVGSGQVDSTTLDVVEDSKVECTLARIGAVS